MPSELQFPESLETERVVLRGYARRDAADLLNLVARNRQRLLQDFPPMAKGFENLEEAQSFIEEKREHADAGKAFCYGIWRKGPAELIGQLQAKNLVWDIPAAELAYFIDSNWLRQGYASETIRAVLQLAFQKLAFQRIFLRILSSNRESLALAKKLGFEEEGLHHNAFRSGHGKLHDVQVLALTPGTYRLLAPDLDQEQR